jgi:hypothetical protein
MSKQEKAEKPKTRLKRMWVNEREDGFKVEVTLARRSEDKWDEKFEVTSILSKELGDQVIHLISDNMREIQDALIEDIKLSVGGGR